MGADYTQYQNDVSDGGWRNSVSLPSGAIVYGADMTQIRAHNRNGMQDQIPRPA